MRLKLSAAALLLLQVVFPSAGSANVDIFIVPHDTALFQIFDQDLLENDLNATAVIEVGQTSRGSLQREGAQITYTPNEEFFAARMDTFSYLTDDPSSGRVLVFLLIDGFGPPELSPGVDIEILSDPAELILRPGVQGIGVLTPTAPVREIGLLIDPADGSRYFEISRVAESARGPSEDSSKIEIEIDPAGFDVGVGESDIATIATNGEPDLELRLGHDGASYRLTARAWPANGPALELPPAALSGPERITLSLWSASGEGAAVDGGFALALGDRLVASTSSFDPSDSLFADEIRIRFGTSDTQSSGALLLAEPRYWRARRPTVVVMTPIFADGAESDDTSLWDGAVGDVEVSAEAAILGTRGFAIGASLSSYLVDSSPQSEPHYRARFNLDPSALLLAEGHRLTLLEGIGGLGTAFTVDLLQHSGRLDLCGTALDSSGSAIQIGCSEIDASSDHSIEVKWWADPTGAGHGGLRIRRRDPAFAEPSTQIAADFELDNGGRDIEQIHLGAIGPEVGTAGTLHLDDFESWR